jgi:hypothetical protein
VKFDKACEPDRQHRLEDGLRLEATLEEVDADLLPVIG